jgi:glyoxylase-like metal-dependent hydrolase (beta-lactamase superfamily II)
MSGHDWYVTRRVLPGIWLIAEPQHCYMWLVEGSERAVLFDTGVGFQPLRPVVERLTPLPVTVVNSHCHIDHIGANHEFDRIEIHELGASSIATALPESEISAYLDYAMRQVAALPAYEALDREFFWLLTTSSAPRSLGAEPPHWTIRPTQAASTFIGGEKIDLGDRVLTVIHTPGHSHDSICLLDERDGIMLTGDTVGYGALYAHWSDSDPEVYARSLDMLRGLDAAQLMLASHYPHVIADVALLGDLAEAMARVCSGDAPRARARDILGNDVFESRFDYFFITTPAAT